MWNPDPFFVLIALIRSSVTTHITHVKLFFFIGSITTLLADHHYHIYVLATQVHSPTENYTEIVSSLEIQLAERSDWEHSASSIGLMRFQ